MRHHQENMTKVRDILKSNGFPFAFVGMCINKFNDNKNTGRGRATRFSDFHTLVVWLRTSWGASIARRPAGYNLRTIGMLHSELKDKLDKGMMSESVYWIPCSCHKLYVGQTKQWLSSRVYQHRIDCMHLTYVKFWHSCVDRSFTTTDVLHTSLQLSFFSIGAVF